MTLAVVRETMALQSGHLYCRFQLELQVLRLYPMMSECLLILSVSEHDPRSQPAHMSLSPLPQPREMSWVCSSLLLEMTSLHSLN